MTAPYASAPVEIEITAELNSKPYIDMTLAVMSDFGVGVERDGYKNFLVPSACYSPLSEYSIESDASAASCFFAAPAICGGSVRVDAISRGSKQGDIKFLDVLAQMGCGITEDENSIKVSGPAELMGLDVDMRDISDTALTLSVVAPFAASPTRIRGIASARLKETDRVSAVCAELRKIGVRVDEHEDGMTIFPCGQFHPALIQTYNDHRMAMAFSLIGLRVPGITIENPGCVSKTFPNFFEVQEGSAMISLGLTGYPLTHSLSPNIHLAAMEYCGLKGSYVLFPLPPDDLRGLKELLDRVRNGGITGLNVTIPHKQNVLPMLDELTPVAQAVGAVNTIFMRNGRLTGDNTDAPGFLADLNRCLAADLREKEGGKRSLVLGAGGAARAVAFALVNDGWQVSIAARRPEQALALISQFPDHASRLTTIDFHADGFRAAVSDLSLIVNATPLGMPPAVEKSPWPAGIPLPRRAVVYDLVYSPRETKFVLDARSAGLRAFSGLGMLVEQARLAFKIWTGFDVPRESLYAAMEEK